MQLAASADLEAVCGISRFDLQADIDFQLFFKTFLQVAGSDVFAALSRKRALVDMEIHAQGRLFDGDARHRQHMVSDTERLTDGDVRDTGDHDDITAVCLFHTHTGQPLVDEDLRSLFVSHIAFVIADDDRLLCLQRSLEDTSDAQASDVFVIGQGRDLHLQWFLVQIRIWFTVTQDRLKQRLDAVAWRIHVVLDDAFSGDAIENREIQLFIAGIQIQEQLIDLIDDFLCPLVFLVDLVDQQDRTQSVFQRLA